MKRITIALSLTMASLVSMAQINVFSGNNVGIGAGLTSSLSSLSINTTGVDYASLCLAPATTSPLKTRGLLVNNITSTTQNFVGIGTVFSNTNGSQSVLRGIWGYTCNPTAQAVGQAYGVIGTAGNCTTGYNFGVLGNIQGTNGGAAIYGYVGSSQPCTSINRDTIQYAGYFVGKVSIIGSLWVNGIQITSSDQKLKKNIAVLDSSDRIFMLTPKKYFYKTRKELISGNAITLAKSDTAKTTATIENETPDYTKKQHYGFIAQDLQKIYPDLVYTSGDGTLGVDYQGLIPIIIAQLKVMKQSQDQMQKQMDAKDARIEALEQALAKLTGKK